MVYTRQHAHTVSLNPKICGVLGDINFRINADQFESLDLKCQKRCLCGKLRYRSVLDVVAFLLRLTHQGSGVIVQGSAREALAPSVILSEG